MLTHQLGTLAVLQEDQSSILAPTALVTPTPRNTTASSGLLCYSYPYSCAHVCVHAHTHIHMRRGGYKDTKRDRQKDREIDRVHGEIEPLLMTSVNIICQIAPPHCSAALSSSHSQRCPRTCCYSPLSCN